MGWPTNDSKKQSGFTNVSEVPSGAYFGLFNSTTNYRISYENLLTSLGVTGSLEQLGDSGQPLLYQAGGTNYIRNIIGGFGVTLTQEPTDEVTISIGYTFNDTGAALVTDPLSPTPAFKSLVAGTGVSIAEAATTIQISASNPDSGNRVVVTQLSDFPAPVLGVITLDPATTYFVVDDISSANRFVMGSNTTILGSSQQNTTLTYTGVGAMFTWVDATVDFTEITLSAPSGSMFSGVNVTPATYSASANSVAFICDEIGALGNSNGILFGQCIFVATTNGATMSGAQNYILFDGCFISIVAGTALDLGSSTFSGLTMINSVVTSTGGASLLDGLPNSGNVNAGGIGTIINSRNSGVAALAGNIVPDDAGWYFFGNDTITDTRPDALLSSSANALVTTIVSAGVSVPVNAVFTSHRASQFSNTAAGVSTYIGRKPAIVPITVSASVTTVSGGDKQVGVSIAVNGTVIAPSRTIGTASSTKSAPLTSIWQIVLNPNDTVQAFTSNQTDTTDIVVMDVVLRVN